MARPSWSAALAVLAIVASAGVARAQGRVEGVDVSEFQGNIDWASVRAAGIGFAITRVSDGTGHRDHTFQRNWDGIKAQGLVRGVYQFFRGSDDPVAQADLLCNAIGALGPGDLPPVADVEVMDGVGAGTLAARLDTWCRHVKARTGKTPVIYTAPGFWNPLGTSFGGEDLWVANWFVNNPSIPRGWGSWTFWQYSDHGSVPGIPGVVDRDVFHGTLADLRTYAHGGGTGAVGGGGGGGGGGGSSGQPTLKYGSRGAAVKHLQQLLDAHGYHVAVDGDFGHRTDAAVRAFQRTHGLTADGVVGPHTWAALNASSTPAGGGSAPPPPSPPSAAHPTLRLGSHGAAVKELQRDLAAKGFSTGAIDGDFGPRTDREVRAFQRSRRLTADGIVGPRTWAALTR